MRSIEDAAKSHRAHWLDRQRVGSFSRAERAPTCLPRTRRALSKRIAKITAKRSQTGRKLRRHGHEVRFDSHQTTRICHPNEKIDNSNIKFAKSNSAGTPLESRLTRDFLRFQGSERDFGGRVQKVYAERWRDPRPPSPACARSRQLKAGVRFLVTIIEGCDFAPVRQRHPARRSRRQAVQIVGAAPYLMLMALLHLVTDLAEITSATRGASCWTTASPPVGVPT